MRKFLHIYVLFSLLPLVLCSSCQQSVQEPTLTQETVITPTKASTLASTPLTSPATPSIGDPFAPELGSSDYDVQHYDIQIDIDPAQVNQLKADVIIQAVSKTDGLRKIALDFIGYQVKGVLVNGETAEYSRNDDKLLVLLPESLPADTPFSVEVGYSGLADLRQSRYVTFEATIGPFFRQGESFFILSEPDGARFWLPCNDHPRDKATFRFEVGVPHGYTAVSNGLLLKSMQGKDWDTFIWQHDYPMATYAATIAVDKYEVLEYETENGTIMRHYFTPARQDAAAAMSAVIDEALPWMEQMLGTYPFEAYGHVTVDASGVAFESQTMVVMANYMLSERVVVHELAHMWFGDWVSLDSWGEMWRNEGFATYFEDMWMLRDDPAAFKRMMDDRTQKLYDDESLEALGRLSPGNLFGLESYDKGAVVVHQLRQEVGDEAFFSGLQQYFQLYGGGTASDEDFINVMEEAANKELDEFFDDWLTN